MVDDYRLSAKIKSDRGNSCLKNCVTDKDHDFVASGAPLKNSEPVSYMDSGLEYSVFNSKCDEPTQNYCSSNAQVISKYSPGGLLMIEQNENNLSTNSGLSLSSTVIKKNPHRELNMPVKGSTDDENTIEHFTTGGVVELILIVFLASWCPHCKDAKPHLDKFKKLHHNKDMENTKITVIEYDSEKHKDKVKEHGVSGFPTYKLIKKHEDGKESIIDHGGGRLYDDLVSFCKKHL